MHCYGKQADHILNNMPETANEVDLLLAEAQYTIQHELCNNLEDFFERRTGRIFFNMPSIAPHTEAVADHFAQLLNWTDDQRQAAMEQLQRAIQAVTVFPEQEAVSIEEMMG